MELEVLISSSDRSKFPEPRRFPSTRILTPAFSGINLWIWVMLCPKSISNIKLKTFSHNKKFVLAVTIKFLLFLRYVTHYPQTWTTTLEEDRGHHILELIGCCEP